MKKDLTLCLDSFSGVEKKCNCIENTSKTFHSCPIGKFKLQNVNFHLFFNSEAIYSYVTNNICNPTTTYLSATGTSCKATEHYCLTTRNVCNPTTNYLSATGAFCKVASHNYSATRNVCSPTSNCFSAAGIYLSPTNVVSISTLRCWNRPYY